MPKGIKGSSEASTKTPAAATTKSSPAKVKASAAKSSAKMAPKPIEMPPEKINGAAPKPKLSVQKLRERVEQLEKINSKLRVKNKSDRKSLIEALARIDTLQAELQDAKTAAPIPEVASVAEEEPSAAPAATVDTKTKSATKAKRLRPIAKRGKAKS
jgi:TolA-binding protein